MIGTKYGLSKYFYFFELMQEGEYWIEAVLESVPQSAADLYMKLIKCLGLFVSNGMHTMRCITAYSLEESVRKAECAAWRRSCQGALQNNTKNSVCSAF